MTIGIRDAPATRTIAVQARDRTVDAFAADAVAVLQRRPDSDR